MRAMLRLTVSVIAIGLAAAAFASPAHAQDDERARLHFEAGRSHFDQGRYENALLEFQESYALSGRAALLFNIGTTLERLARWDEAADHFAEFLTQNPSYERRTDLESRIANLRRRAAESGARRGPSDLAFVGAGVLIGSGAALIASIVLAVLAIDAEDQARRGCFARGTCMPDDVAGIDDLAVATDVTGTASLGLALLGAALIGIAHAGMGVAVVLAASIAGAASAMIWAGPRVTAEMARDRVLPGWLGRTDVRGVPRNSLGVQALWSCGLVATGSFESIVVFGGVPLLVWSAATALAVVVLRWREPDLARPFRVPLYPLLPLLCAAGFGAVAGVAAFERPTEALAGLATVAAGLAVRPLWGRFRHPNLEARSSLNSSPVME